VREREREAMEQERERERERELVWVYAAVGGMINGMCDWRGEVLNCFRQLVRIEDRPKSFHLSLSLALLSYTLCW
jgi:hypothetical protein